MPEKQKIVFIAWKRLSRRTELLSEALNAQLLFFKDGPSYIRAAISTIKKIAKIKPTFVLVQLPQGPLLLEALILRTFYKYKLIADVHTGFLMKWEWKSLILNLPFKAFLKKCDLIVIHNKKMRELLPKGLNKKTLVVYDPWYLIKSLPNNIGNEKYVVFPASYHPDEPLEEVLEAVKNLCPNVKLKVTGNWKRRQDLKKYESERISFTGFLNKEEYEALIANSSGIISGTKEEYTALMSAWEAVAYSKPLAINETEALRECYASYPCFYNWKNQESIAYAVNNLLSIAPDINVRNILMKSTIDSINKLKSILKKLYF